MWISTFHALCARLLRREAPDIGLSRDFVIYDSADQQSIVKQLLKEYGLDDNSYQPRAVLSRISHAKNRMEGPDTLRRRAGIRRDREIARLFAGYQRTLKDASALDFDDLLLKTVELFDQAPAVRERYARKFQFVMVDEYQDTNRPQYLLIKQLASQHRNLAVVGDPDQSIYKWRGADLRNILDFETDFPEVGRRPARAQLPVDAGHSRCGVGGHRATTATARRKRSGPTARAAPRSSTSAAPTSSKKPTTSRESRAQRWPRTSSTRWPCSTAPTRSPDRWKTALRQANIAYVVLGGVGFYERKEIKDALAYLKLILNPARRRRAAPRHQRACARHRQRRDGRAGAGRRSSAGANDLPPLFAGLQPDRRVQLALGKARHRDGPAAAELRGRPRR